MSLHNRFDVHFVVLSKELCNYEFIYLAVYFRPLPCFDIDFEINLRTSSVARILQWGLTSHLTIRCIQERIHKVLVG